MKQKAIVLVSGGVDSVTSLYWAINHGYEAIILTINYKSRPDKELEITRLFGSITSSKVIEVDLPFLSSAETLMQDKYPVDFNGIKDDGYIPAKNLIFYSLATYFAEAYGAEFIIGGHIGPDTEIYPDTTESYFHELEKLIANSLITTIKQPPKIVLPLSKLNKEGVGKLAKNLGIPLEKTWSCYKNGENQCGTCLSCLERAQALLQFNF